MSSTKYPYHKVAAAYRNGEAAWFSCPFCKPGEPCTTASRYVVAALTAERDAWRELAEAHAGFDEADISDRAKAHKRLIAARQDVNELP